MYFDLTDALMGLVGGLLIGCSAALLLLVNGRIAGVSGIASRMIAVVSEARSEAIAFAAGLVAAPVLYSLVVGAPAIGIVTEPVVLAIGGLLVGFGSVTGNGCTSGHGVCGMSRFSVRSLVATGVFMVVAVLVAVLVRPMVVGG